MASSLGKSRQGDGEQGGVSELMGFFPITRPFPDPLQDEDLIPPADVALEQDLLRNAANPRAWNGYLHHVLTSNKPSQTQNLFQDADANLSSEQVRLLGPMASPSNRLGLRRIAFAYERAFEGSPTSYTLWKDYLLQRMVYVMGEPSGSLATFWKRQISQGKEKLDAGPTLLDDKEGFAEQWDWSISSEAQTSSLNGIAGHKEWEDLAAVFERALMRLPKAPRIWLLYFTVLMHPSCPPTLSYTHARRTFDRALRTLPPSLHLRIWKYYLRWAEARGTETCLRIWRRYLRVDASLTERYVRILERLRKEEEEEEEEEEERQEGDDGNEVRALLKTQRAVEAVKILLKLANDAIEGRYVSPEGKSPFQLLNEWLELCERYADEIGMEPEEDAEHRDSALRLTADTLDPMKSSKIPVGQIVRALGLKHFNDQAGRLWTGLATYWIRRGDLEEAKSTFEEGMAAVLTVRDFTQIFDAYAETSENIMGYMMDELAQDEGDAEAEEEEEEGSGRVTREAELDQRMADFEQLMERRPFLLNDVLLRRNPNDVQEWEKRVTLHGDDDGEVAKTYQKAIDTINPRKATANFHQLHVNYARFYEEGGSGDKPDAEAARRVLEKATTIPFVRVDDLADIWCEWAELEIRLGNFDAALRVMSRATASPKTAAAIKAISYLDDSMPVQKRLFKSSRLWAFYIDLEESIGSIDSARQTYDRMIELKIATPQVIINYARFLEEQKYFEDAFRVYERGIDAFTYPVAFELWNIYLSKFVKRHGANKLERARDLFEQALEKCPDKYCRPLFLMYGKLEEEHGLAKRAMGIYERATEQVPREDKFNMFVFYVAKVASNFGLAATRPVYQRAIEVLPDKQTAEMCLRFAQLERKLGEIDRARVLFAHASQFCDPRTEKDFWSQWNAFEIEHGSEDTFREMLRIRRSVQAQFNTDTSYIAAYASAQQKANAAASATSNGSANIITGSGARSAQAPDAMALAEQEAAAKMSVRTGSGAAPAFVSAKQGAPVTTTTGNTEKLGANGGDEDGDDDDLM